MPTCHVVVIGGYGFFGRRLVERLARHPDLHVLIAGRSLADGTALARELAGGASASLDAVRLDAQAGSFPSELRSLAPHILVNASGPFQDCDYRVPAACIAAGVHHVDLADARTYVAGIRQLDEAARAAGVFVTSGASSVPALSSAAADHLAHGMARVHDIDIGISPGNRTGSRNSGRRGWLSTSWDRRRSWKRAWPGFGSWASPALHG